MWRSKSRFPWAAASVAGCFLLVVVQRNIADPLGGILASIIFLVMVLVAGILGGWIGGSIATLAGVVSAVLLFSPPFFNKHGFTTVKLLHLAAFVLLGGVISALCELWLRALKRAELRQKRLEDEIQERKRAQMAERDRADELLTTLASIGDGVIRTDGEGRIRYMNPVAEDLTGFTSDHAEGQLLSDVFLMVSETTRQPMANPATQSLMYGRIVGLSSDAILISKVGRDFPIENSASPILDISGNVIGSVLVFRDISERQRGQASLRESELRYRAIGESIDYGVWICDKAGRNIHSSESFLRLVGMTQEECSEYGWAKALYPDDFEATIIAWKECVRTESRWDQEHRYLGVDGQYHYLLSRGVPVRNDAGEVTSWVGVMLDISRQKQVESELRDNDRRKDEFLAILAHELRNPLAPIVNSIQILKIPTADSVKLQNAREMMERQVHHLVRLVDDLLDVSRVMRGKIELHRERLELATVVARAVETAQPLIEAQNHRLEITMPSESLLLHADPVRLSQALGNLLTNSAKYTNANGRIELIAQQEGDQAVLRVRDNGIGIDLEMLSHIFDLFVQADHSSTKTHGGLGIGLTLVRSLIEMHGGSVQAHSAGVGLGSEFVVYLPLAKETEIALINGSSIPDSEKPLTPSMRLLVVDDNKDAATSLEVLLSLMGHDVQVANSGKDALDLVSNYRPHLVLLDLGMPNMDGYEVTRRLREIPELESTVIVALTGWGQAEDRRRTAEAGFDHHLLKPLNPGDLESILTICSSRHIMQTVS
jgi:PAS domain S-box-containing protein